MSCAGCAARVQQALDGVDGAQAEVNLAIDSAEVAYDPRAHRRRQPGRAVESAGYSAPESAAWSWPSRPATVARPAPDRLCRRWVFRSMAVSMVEPLQFDYWQWLALALATAVVVLWGGAPFISRGALRAARHRSATMDTLVALGSLVALVWSALTITLSAGPREPMCACRCASIPPMPAEHTDIYLEVAAGIVVLDPPRPLARGSALAARAGSGPARAARRSALPTVVVRRDGGESARWSPPRAWAVGDVMVVVRPGERVGADGVVRGGRPRRSIRR